MIKSEQRKRDTFKNWPLIRNPKFYSYSHETCEVIIFTKFHEYRTKIVDFLLLVNFWKCPVFFPQTLVQKVGKNVIFTFLKTLPKKDCLCRLVNKILVDIDFLQSLTNFDKNLKCTDLEWLHQVRVTIKVLDYVIHSKFNVDIMFVKLPHLNTFDTIFFIRLSLSLYSFLEVWKHKFIQLC